MKLIAFKTNDGELKGNIAFYCKMLHVSRQGFYKYLMNQDRPYKYQLLADAMLRRNGIAEATPFPENIPMLFYECRPKAIPFCAYNRRFAE